jgi:transposase
VVSGRKSRQCPVSFECIGRRRSAWCTKAEFSVRADSETPAVGPLTALTGALEVGEVQRFSSIKKAISYCGLCGDEPSSATRVQRPPLSKQRNKHLQTTLLEAAKMAPRNNAELAMLYDKEKHKGNANRATLAVARKLVAYLMAVDRRQRNFQVVETTSCIAP